MPGFIQSFADILDLGMNLLQLLALIVSIFTFFFLMINRYSKALRVILYPYGLGFISKVRIMFICRKTHTKKRAFIEYAILNCRGRHLPSSEWRAIISGFKSFYKDDAVPTWTIPNCTLLIGSEFSEMAERYFTYFSDVNVRKTFGIEDDRIEWVIRIHIEEAYATPTCLLTGLISKYEENWNEFIKRYVSTMYITDEEDDKSKIILPNELYLTFAWLLWGPSYEIQYASNGNILCQLSFGDESNSIPVFTSSTENIASDIKEIFNDTTKYGYGALLSLDLSVYNNRPYIKDIRQSVSPKFNYFYDKIENSDLSFALQIDGFTPCQGYKAQSYYCTAYVWVLFELVDESFRGFRPETSLAFFEHSNLTDMDTYKFLTERLIDKSIKHFESIFGNSEYEGRKYRFVCAMNKRIEEELQAAYNKRSKEGDELARAFKDRVELIPQRTPSEVFASFDEFFMPNIDFTYHELDADDKKSRSDLGTFYTDIYMDCFPDPDERESFENLMHYLSEGKKAQDYVYHIVLVKDKNEQIVAGAIFDYFISSKAGMIEFIAVKPNLQSSGLGSLLYNHVYTILDSDARRHSNCEIRHIFCEIDAPSISRSKDKKYLYFWDKQNYKRIDMNYIQPKLSMSQEAVDGLWLTVTSPGEKITEIPSKMVLAVIRDYMKYCMGIKNPEKSDEYKKMDENIGNKKRIKLNKII